MAGGSREEEAAEGCWAVPCRLCNCPTVRLKQEPRESSSHQQFIREKILQLEAESWSDTTLHMADSRQGWQQFLLLGVEEGRGKGHQVGSSVIGETISGAGGKRRQARLRLSFMIKRIR